MTCQVEHYIIELCIGVKPGLEPIVIIFIDLTLITVFSFLWLTKFNLIKKMEYI